MYQRILVPTDGSATAEKGLQEAIAVARLSGGRIRLLHVVDAMSVAIGAEAFAGYAADVLPVLRDAGNAILRTAQASVSAAGVAVDHSLREVLSGRVADEVVAEAEQWKADLIVIGTHGRRGVRRLVLGSDAEHVLRAAKVPVLLVRGE